MVVTVASARHHKMTLAGLGTVYEDTEGSSLLLASENAMMALSCGPWARESANDDQSGIGLI